MTMTDTERARWFQRGGWSVPWPSATASSAWPLCRPCGASRPYRPAIVGRHTRLPSTVAAVVVAVCLLAAWSYHDEAKRIEKELTT